MLFTEFVMMFTDLVLYLTFLIFPLYLWDKKEKRILPYYFIFLFLTIVITYLLKGIFNVHRPPDAIIHLSSNAFPSTHSALAFFLLGFFYYKKRWRIPLLLYGILVACSRVYLRVHYVADVIVGAIIGFSIPYLLYNYMLKKEENRR
ncbi:MAG: phosphatase PAP2 family protein [Candidatus Aenigmarchaeota archaeon]|nr:phosphatase PAP2 family protein [Candidatus Aenigmarchaeota archaeon]